MRLLTGWGKGSYRRARCADQSPRATPSARTARPTSHGRGAKQDRWILTAPARDFGCARQVPTGKPLRYGSYAGAARRPLPRCTAPRLCLLRLFLSKKIPSCWSFCPAWALLQQLHSSLCACFRALTPNKNPAQSGIFFSGNRLSAQRVTPVWRLPSYVLLVSLADCE